MPPQTIEAPPNAVAKRILPSIDDTLLYQFKILLLKD